MTIFDFIFILIVVLLIIKTIRFIKAHKPKPPTNGHHNIPHAHGHHNIPHAHWNPKEEK